MGTGKTTLARYFLSRLDARTATAFVLYPALTAAELLRSILDDLHVPATGDVAEGPRGRAPPLPARGARGQGRDVVLLIDEAQDLSPEVLEQVRLISNLETDTEKLIQIVLMGQSELQEMLARHELRQLAQRVTARYHLSALTRPETEDYIRHRLAVAGGEGKVAFTATRSPPCTELSGGIPRLINLICDRALLAGYVAGSARDRRGAWCARPRSEVLGARPRGPAPAPRPASRGAARCSWRCWRALAPRRAQAPDAATGLRRAPRAAARTAPRPLLPAPARSTLVVRDAAPRRLVHGARSARVQALWGDAAARADGAAHAHRPGARVSTCRSCSRCSTPRGATPATLALAAHRRATRPSWPPATAAAARAARRASTACGRGRPCSCGGTSTPSPAAATRGAAEPGRATTSRRLGYLRAPT